MADLNPGAIGPYEDFPGAIPAGWNPERAVTFLQAVLCIDHYLNYQVPITSEMVAVIFFHESAFSDARQLIAKDKNKPKVLTPEGPGIGFGQIEVKNSDKPLFFKTVFRDPYDLGPFDANAMGNEMIDKMLQNEEFAIQVHCEYLWYLHGNQVREHPNLGKDDTPQQMESATRALLLGQVGEKNKSLIDLFLSAETALFAALESGADREAIIDALNKCGRSVPLDQFKEYWDFTLPKEDLPAILAWYNDPYQ